MLKPRAIQNKRYNYENNRYKMEINKPERKQSIIIGCVTAPGNQAYNEMSTVFLGNLVV